MEKDGQTRKGGTERREIHDIMPNKRLNKLDIKTITGKGLQM